MRNILIIDGHPDDQSLCASLALSYQAGALKSGFETTVIKLRELDFNLNLQHGYRKRTELEPDLLKTIELLKKADHLVFVYPIWWGTFPALLKGFFDRVFLPGITFTPSQGYKWGKLLTGKTGRLIATMDSPLWYNRFFYKNPSQNALKKATLQFCGVRKVRIKAFAPIKTSTEEKRKKWITEVEILGMKGK